MSERYLERLPDRPARPPSVWGPSQVHRESSGVYPLAALSMNNQGKIEKNLKKLNKTKSSQTEISISRVVFGVADFDFLGPGTIGEMEFWPDRAPAPASPKVPLHYSLLIPRGINRGQPGRASTCVSSCLVRINPKRSEGYPSGNR